jgi:uncharacterized repeat protein (TIGR02543 family)
VTYDSAYGTLATTSRTGYTFNGWFTAVSGGTEVTAATIVKTASNHTLYAQWTINTYTITASAGTGGSIDPSGIVSVIYGNDQSFTITADTGYRINNVVVDGTSEGAVSSYTFENVATDHTIAASFQKIYNLTVNKGGNGKGTVISDPSGISCLPELTSCSADFDEGKSVTLTASASPGSTFMGWSDGCSGTGTCTVVMSAAKSVTATFTLNTYTLTIGKVGQGTVISVPGGIDCGSACSASFDYGTSVTLIPTPASGYSFDVWSGTNAGDLTYNNDGTWSIIMTGPKSLTANFVTGIVITAFDDFYEMAQRQEVWMCQLRMACLKTILSLKESP